MLPDPEALRQVVSFLVEERIPYMVIGGLANAVWGQPRLTHDADFKVSLGDQPLSDFRIKVLARFPERETNIPLHKRSPQVIHIWGSTGVPVDILASLFDYERDAIARAVERPVQGVPVRVCTAEDFVIHKAVANREQDWIDMERVLIRQRGILDHEYILGWLRQFAEALESAEMLARYQALRARHDPDMESE